MSTHNNYYFPPDQYTAPSYPAAQLRLVATTSHSNAQPLLGKGLAARSAGLRAAFFLLDTGAFLLHNNLHVGGIGHVWVDAAVGAVGAAALFDSPVDLHMCDFAVINIEALDLSVSLNIGEQAKEVLASLLRPPNLGSLRGDILRLRMAPAPAGEALERHSLLPGNNIVEVDLGLLKAHALDGMADLAHVLKVHSERRGPGLGRLVAVVGFPAVLGHGSGAFCSFVPFS